MGKVFGRVHKYIKPNFTFFVPPCNFLSSNCDSSNYFGVTVIYHKQPSPISNLTTTKQVDTNRKNYDNTQSFATPIKKI